MAPVGVIVFALGVWIHESAPPGSLPGLLLVLLVAFTGQAVGNAALGYPLVDSAERAVRRLRGPASP